MDLILAKKLKDAGFPQISCPEEDSELTFTYVPTLEELIEACEDVDCPLVGFGGSSYFTHLQKNPNPKGEKPWSAVAWLLDAGTDNYLYGYGDTPSEAVANLYLALKGVK